MPPAPQLGLGSASAATLPATSALIAPVDPGVGLDAGSPAVPTPAPAPAPATTPAPISPAVDGASSGSQIMFTQDFLTLPDSAFQDATGRAAQQAQATGAAGGQQSGAGSGIQRIPAHVITAVGALVLAMQVL